jgi:hypothetical protein
VVKLSLSLEKTDEWFHVRYYDLICPIHAHETWGYTSMLEESRTIISHDEFGPLVELRKFCSQCSQCRREAEITLKSACYIAFNHKMEIKHISQTRRKHIKNLCFGRLVNTGQGISSRNFDHQSKHQPIPQETSSADMDANEEIETRAEDSLLRTELMGQKKIAAWKAGSGGKGKDWRRYSYTKVLTKRQKPSHYPSARKTLARGFKIVNSFARSLALKQYEINPVAPAAALKSRQAQLPRKSKSRSVYVSNLDLVSKPSKNVRQKTNHIFRDDIPAVQARVLSYSSRRINRYGTRQGL